MQCDGAGSIGKGAVGIGQFGRGGKNGGSGGWAFGHNFVGLRCADGDGRAVSAAWENVSHKVLEASARDGAGRSLPKGYEERQIGPWVVLQELRR